MAEQHLPPPRSTPERIFISSDEPRMRAGWRIAIHTAAYNILLIALSIPALAIIFLFDIPPDNLFLASLLPILPVTMSVFLARRYLDKRSIASLGLKIDRYALFDLLAGIVIPFLMIGSIFWIELSLGWLEVDGFAWDDSPRTLLGLSLPPIVVILLTTVAWFLAFVFVSWNEELLFRGYRLHNLSEGLSPAWGLLISSLWFGIVHLGNPNSGARMFVATGIFLAGAFMAYGYLTTRQLWLPIGLHLGWNFFEGVVFGFPVSGLSTFQLMRVTITGPVLWTGGDFGPEAGLLLLPALLFGTILVYAYTKLRAKWLASNED